jgi:predicted anti-sigma-YlaC factor YlaD
MKCEDFRESVQRMLDSEAEIVLAGELLAHAETCAQCRAFFESSLALHRAMSNLPRVSLPPDLLTSLQRIGQLDFVPVKLGWGPEIRLAAEMLIPIILTYAAQAFSFNLLQHVLEMLMVPLGLALLGIAALKPHILGGPGYRLAPEEH